MKNIFLQNLPFLKFLGKFLGIYIAFTLLYNLYLKSFDAAAFEPDSITVLVAENAAQLLKWSNFEMQYAPTPNDPSIAYIINGKRFVRIVEGCNAMSVIILFVSFIVAFSNGIWRTCRFLILGILVIYFLNVLRIALLTAGLFYYPAYKNILHDIVFPLFIYGVVFGLWIIWVNKFSNYRTHVKR